MLLFLLGLEGDLKLLIPKPSSVMRQEAPLSTIQILLFISLFSTITALSKQSPVRPIFLHLLAAHGKVRDSPGGINYARVARSFVELKQVSERDGGRRVNGGGVEPHERFLDDGLADHALCFAYFPGEAGTIASGVYDGGSSTRHSALRLPSLSLWKRIYCLFLPSKKLCGLLVMRVVLLLMLMLRAAVATDTELVSLRHHTFTIAAPRPRHSPWFLPSRTPHHRRISVSGHR